MWLRGQRAELQDEGLNVSVQLGIFRLGFQILNQYCHTFLQLLQTIQRSCLGIVGNEAFNANLFGECGVDSILSGEQGGFVEAKEFEYWEGCKECGIGVERLQLLCVLEVLEGRLGSS